MTGDVESVTLEARFVRLAPLWIDDQSSWEVTLVNIEMKDRDLCKVQLSYEDSLSFSFL